MYFVVKLNDGHHPKDRKHLAIGWNFKCAKQPLGSLHYGYYTCEHLRVTGQYRVDRDHVSYHCVV
jgi:hypothetical protein